MKSIRRIHAWLGVLFAPSIILFALSGMFQVNGCHDEADANPAIVRLAQIHMKQTVSLPKRRAPRPEAATAPAAAPKPEMKHEAEPFRPIKLFFILMCLGLISSALLGIWIAFTSKRDQKLHIGLLALGVALPIVMLLV